MPTTDRTDTCSGRSALLTLDTSDDPSGAAIVWPLVMVLIYAALGLGFVLAR